MKNCYVLFVKTGHEERLVRKLACQLDADFFYPFVPKKEKFFRRNGETARIIEICFWGYIFIESEFFADNFSNIVSPIIRASEEIYKVLNYGDRRNIEMSTTERETLRALFGGDYCIDCSSGFMEGDRIRVTEGALVGIEDIIKKINRHKREAMIEIEFMGGLRQILVGLEIIERI